MKIHDRLFARPWIAVAIVAALFAGHIFLYTILRHRVLSAAVASVLIVVVAIKHLGLLSALIAGMRRRSRPSKRT